MLSRGGPALKLEGVISRSLEAESFNDLTGGTIMQAAKFEAVFIAATMSPPGIEPPLELR